MTSKNNLPLDTSGENRFYNGVEVDGRGPIPNKFLDRELWSRLPKTLDEPTVTVNGVELAPKSLREFEDGE